MTNLKLLTAKTLRLFAPPPDLTVSECAQRYRYLSPEACPEPGPWRNARAPHLVAPMDALSPSDPCRRVVCMFASQTGKTEVILNFILFSILMDPGPILAVQPNERPMGEAFSKDRIAPMIRDCPELKALVTPSKGRISGNTIMHKAFKRGQLSISGANSPAGLASRPIRYLAADELDRWEKTREGSSLWLARKRMQRFHNRKEILVSSPTYEGVGIHQEYHLCEQQWEWQIMCQECGTLTFPELDHFDYEGDNHKDVSFKCPHCGAAHSQDMEDQIKAEGAWVCQKDGGEESKGFWMSQWGSPFARWGETVKEYLDAKGDSESLQVVTNTAFAQVWDNRAEGIEPHILMSRREEYPADCPNGVILLTLGVDVQRDRLECQVLGHGHGEETWNIDYRVLKGDPTQQDVWTDLQRFITDGRYKHETHGKLKLSGVCIDEGYLPAVVRSFVMLMGLSYVWPTKGLASAGYHFVEERTARERRIRKKRAKSFSPERIGTHEGKTVLMSRLQGVLKPGPGYCHFPMERDEEYFLGLTAERAETKYRRGFKYVEFVQYHKRNEPLDTWLLAMAAKRLLYPNLDRIEKELKGELRRQNPYRIARTK